MGHGMNPVLRILIVEDSATIRGLLRRILGTAYPGAMILECGDGLAALGQLRRFPIQLLVTDLQMPGLNGKEMLVQALQEDLLKGTRVLVLSSAFDAEKQLAFKGPNDLRVLRKPASVEEIQAAVARLLDPEILEQAERHFHGPGESPY